MTRLILNIFTALSVILCALPMAAQVRTDAVPSAADSLALTDTLVVPEGYELVDSVIFRPNIALDSTLVGKDIFSLINGSSYGVFGTSEVKQSPEIAEAFANYVEANKGRSLNGYRVRIFFDNKRSARAESEKILNEFRLLHHDIQAYRSYVNPYFKVTVGDFRSRSEAMDFLIRIRKEFPSAFIVKEPINYPVVDKTKPVIADTVQVLRRIAPVE